MRTRSSALRGKATACGVAGRSNCRSRGRCGRHRSGKDRLRSREPAIRAEFAIERRRHWGVGQARDHFIILFSNGGDQVVGSRLRCGRASAGTKPGGGRQGRPCRRPEFAAGPINRPRHVPARSSRRSRQPLPCSSAARRPRNAPSCRAGLPAQTRRGRSRHDRLDPGVLDRLRRHFDFLGAPLGMDHAGAVIRLLTVSIQGRDSVLEAEARTVSSMP